MSINTSYSHSFVEQARRDLKEIENKGVSKLETLEDLKDTIGKSFRTSDIEKLMEKYDPDSYEKYKQIAYTSEGGHSQTGLSYLSKWMDDVKAGFAKESNLVSGTNDISSKNEAKLSQKAQDFLKNLRSKYGDFDFMIGNGSDEIRSLSKSGSKEFSVILSSAEIEKMANDEDYAAKKMHEVENSVNMCRKICEQQGYVSAFGSNKEGIGTINKIGVVSDDNGNMKFFAELEKTSDKQKERLEKSREKKAEEKKLAEKRAHKKNPYEKEEKDTVKRTTIEANSYNELLDKLEAFDWSKVADSKSGDRFDFSV